MVRGERVAVPVEQLESLENALGFYPYGDETQIDVSDVGDFTVPQDVRTYLMQKAMEGALGTGDILHARALRRLEVHTAEELEHSSLYEYQQDVVYSIKDFLQYPEYAEDGAPIRHGYIKLPTATGKTAIFAHTVQEITNHISGEQKRLKTLVLVPGRDLVGQIIGTVEQPEDDIEVEEMTRGFAKFAPDMTVTEYHGGKKDLSGDVVVMTYQSMHKAVQEGRFDTEMFDVIVGDEIHRALGVATKSSVTRVIEGKIAIGFSATTEYGKNKRAKDLLPTEIYRLELREAVDKGYLAPVRAIAITTGDTLKATGRKEFKEEELAKLITSEWRNKTAVNIARDFVAEGQQGIITCLPGENLRHAREIAERLKSESIVDVQTGRIRNLKAVHVSGEMPVSERRKLYAQYERGEIDVIASVDLLNEGWDSISAKFLINLRPTTSVVLGTQRLGRILRPGKEGELATVVEFIDNIEKPGAGLFTFYHAMGEREVNQNKIYGHLQRPGSGSPEDPLPRPDLPDDIRDLVAKMNHKILDERIFGHNIEKAPEEFLNATNMAERFDTTSGRVLKIAQELGIVGLNMYFGHVITQGFSPEQQAEIIKQIPQKASEEYKNISNIAEELGVSHSLIRKIVTENDIIGTLLQFTAKTVEGFTSEQTEVIKTHISSIAPEGYVGANAFAKQLGVSRGYLDSLIRVFELDVRSYRSENGRLGRSLSPGQQEIISRPGNIPVDKIEGFLTAWQIGKSYGSEAKTVRKAIKELGIDGLLTRLGGRHVSLTYSPEQQKEIEAALPQEYQEGYFALNPVAVTIGTTHHTLKKIATEQSIKGVLMKFGTKVSYGYTLEQIEQMKALLPPRKNRKSRDN